MPGSSKSFGNRRSDPYAAYNFLIEIDGIIAGGFSEVSGLNIDKQYIFEKKGDEQHGRTDSTWLSS